MRAASPQPCSPARGGRFPRPASPSPARVSCLVIVRLVSWQPCARCRMGDLHVHATARRIHIRLRVAVLCNSPHPASVCSAAAPKQAAHGTSGAGLSPWRFVSLYAPSRLKPDPTSRCVSFVPSARSRLRRTRLASVSPKAFRGQNYRKTGRYFPRCSQDTKASGYDAAEGSERDAPCGG